MKFEIIELSQSQAEYRDRIPDSNFRGYFPGVCCGWSFEFKDKAGAIKYNTVAWFEGSPADYCDTWLQYGPDALFEMERWNGWEPTGRVVFRGYGTEYWYAEERDWCIEEYEPTQEDLDMVSERWLKWGGEIDWPDPDPVYAEEDAWEDWAESHGF